MESWKMNDTVFCLSSTSSAPVSLVILVPPSSTEPALGFIRPPRHFSRVDFPEPEGPTTATASASSIEMLSPLRATTFPSSAFDSYMWYRELALSISLNSPSMSLTLQHRCQVRVQRPSGREKERDHHCCEDQSVDGYDLQPRPY